MTGSWLSPESFRGSALDFNFGGLSSPIFCRRQGASQEESHAQDQRGAASEIRKRPPVKLLITRILGAEDIVDLDVGQPRQTAPHDGIAGRPVPSASEIATESGEFTPNRLTNIASTSKKPDTAQPAT